MRSLILILALLVASPAVSQTPAAGSRAQDEALKAAGVPLERIVERRQEDNLPFGPTTGIYLFEPVRPAAPGLCAATVYSATLSGDPRGPVAERPIDRVTPTSWYWIVDGACPASLTDRIHFTASDEAAAIEGLRLLRRAIAGAKRPGLRPACTAEWLPSFCDAPKARLAALDPGLLLSETTIPCPNGEGTACYRLAGLANGPPPTRFDIVLASRHGRLTLVRMTFFNSPPV